MIQQASGLVLLLTAPIRKFYNSCLRESVVKYGLIIKTKMTSWILIPSQLIHSSNSWPYFMILALCFQISETIIITINFPIRHNREDIFDRTKKTFSVLYYFATYIFIGIPLEIGHGTLPISTTYLLSYAYPEIIGKLIINNDFRLYMDTSIYALAALHFVNVVRNWNNFSYNYLRIVALSLPVISRIYYFIKSALSNQDEWWKVMLVHHTSLFGAIMLGIVLGNYWIYRDEQQDTPATKWKNYSIIITVLAAYFIMLELSELHLTLEKYLDATLEGEEYPLL